MSVALAQGVVVVPPELVTLNATLPCGKVVPTTFEVTVAVKVTAVFTLAVLGPLTEVVVPVAPTVTLVLPPVATELN